MTEECYLDQAYSDLSLLSISSPKKHKEYMVCKIKYSNKDLKLQFPKMDIVSMTDKSMELEFKNEKGYSKVIYNFLSTLEETVLEYIIEHAKEWFGKEIPPTYISSQMYNKFIKAPKTSENKCTINFSFDADKSVVLDKRNEQLELSDIKVGDSVECISQLKYLIFSKDSFFVNWEICTTKVYKKVSKVPKFGFIEDPNDHSTNENDLEDITFF